MNDPRYVAYDEMVAVLHYDMETPEVVAASEELAREYLAGRGSSEYYSLKPVTVVRYLPPVRMLYELRARVPYGPAAEAEPELYEYEEFPGIMNGKIIPLGEVSVGVTDNPPYGWDVNVWAWDQAQAETACAEALEEARRLRAERWEAFSRFPADCVVQTQQGELLTRTTTQNGTPCWRGPDGVIQDASLEPERLTMIANPSGGASGR